MSAMGDRMAAIAAALAARYPARKVRRSLVDFNDLAAADLAAGVYTLVSTGESGFTNVAGYEAQDGRQGILLVGQIRVAETKDKAQAGLLVEEAEFVLIEEVKAFLRALPEALCLLTLENWRQSQQLEEPYGWIACQLEYVP